MALVVEAARHSAVLQLAKYLREISKLESSERDLRDLARHFPDWRRTLHPDRNALADGRPWMSYAATAFLERTLKPESRVFEFGAGGSTLFFAIRARGISVEHDGSWAEMTRAALQARSLDWEVLHVDPETGAPSGDRTDPDSYLSNDPDFLACSFRAYAQSIERFEGLFDVVLIDGRARPSCFKHALPKIARGGWLVLDNAERPAYRHVHERLAQLGWPRHRFIGPAPYLFPFSLTCAWQSPS